MLPELVLPAGSLDKLRVAFAYGADAVYVGARGFSMRPDSAAFSLADLALGAKEARALGKRVYLAANIMLFNNDLPALRKWLEALGEIAIDGLIVGDAGAFSLAKKYAPQIPLHLSTQMGVANQAAAEFWRDQGAARLVLARETTLEDAAKIAALPNMSIEIFVHGALCMAVSGRCLLSAYFTGFSGSRGECKHACRWEYDLREKSRPAETFSALESERGTVLFGSRDLALLEHMPALVKSSVAALKVEGRMKSAYYLAVVARVYRAALARYAASPENYACEPAWLKELQALSHRPYTTGFAFGYPKDAPALLQTENKYETTHQLIAQVKQVAGDELTLLVKNPFAPLAELEWIAPQMQSGSLVIGGVILNETGGQWPLARPASTVRVKAKGELPPAGAFLRQAKPLA